MPIKAVLFDHDGTLVDSEPVHFKLWQQVLVRYGAELSERHYRDYYAGVPTPANALDMVSRFGIDRAPEQLAQEKLQATGDYLAHSAFPLMPAVPETLNRCRHLGLRLAIVTGSGRRVVDATIRNHGLQPLFETSVSSDDVSRNKPHPDGYQLAMRRLDLAAHECIAVEDTEHGLAAAAAAGIRCLAVPNDMSAHHDFSLATATCCGLGDLMLWLEQNR